MKALEVLLSKRWILKSKDRELYYSVRDELPKFKQFLIEKLGFQVIVNPYLIKLEKIPAVAESWMGIREFGDKMEYVIFLTTLMFLEEKDMGEQFVLSELTEYIQTTVEVEQIDWTVYRSRKYLVKVMKYLVSSGILELNDGNEEDFAKDGVSEVLYENTGASRYFVRNFTKDISNFKSISEFEEGDFIDTNEDRGIVRRQRVYRKLLLSPGLYRNEETEEDFQDTMEVVAYAKFDSAFTFQYSKRTGTPAAKWEAVPEDTVKERFQRLLEHIRLHSEEREGRDLGKVMEVLVEEKDKESENMLTGRLSNNVLVHFEGGERLIGEIVPVRLDKSMGFYYYGSVL